MAYTRAYEEYEVSPEMRRMYSQIKANFDIPFVPTLFKVLAHCPAYLDVMWRDLGHVAASKEFHAATVGFEEFIRSEAIRGGWQFSEQERVLATQGIARADMPVIGGLVGVFVRALPRLALFSRLMQRGYSGGQRGRVSDAKHSPALSRMVTVHVPSERDASLRVWLIYSDIKRTTGAKNVMSMFRMLAPYPTYLGSVWVDAKKVLANREFQRSRDQLIQRSIGLLNGLPVRDHRHLARDISERDWRDIEETVDGYAKLLPQLALLSAVWLRSFAVYRGKYAAAS
jgi:hypothetical protein